jgi:hypothetical protein
LWIRVQFKDYKKHVPLFRLHGEREREGERERDSVYIASSSVDINPITKGLVSTDIVNLLI